MMVFIAGCILLLLSGHFWSDVPIFDFYAFNSWHLGGAIPINIYESLSRTQLRSFGKAYSFTFLGDSSGCLVEDWFEAMLFWELIPMLRVQSGWFQPSWGSKQLSQAWLALGRASAFGSSSKPRPQVAPSSLSKVTFYFASLFRAVPGVHLRMSSVWILS